MASPQFGFYEFFAGGGMARLGLGKRWQCLMANEWCPKKARAYVANHGPSPRPLVEDIRRLQIDQLPRGALLAWSSFPCQDLSLAGNGKGLQGERSGTFWPFMNLLRNLQKNNAPVPLLVIENVVGAVTSHGGRDFEAILSALHDSEYRFGPLVVDGACFVPQSRPRLFIIAVQRRFPIPEKIQAAAPGDRWHTRNIRNAYDSLAPRLRANWVWWNLPKPKSKKLSLRDIIEENPEGVVWHTVEETKRLLSLMSDLNKEKVRQAQARRTRVIGTVYKRTRRDADGHRVQRAEVRFDDISGCLRTPGGGSSRQTVLDVEGNQIRSRLMSPREAARLMGLKDTYKLPGNYNEAYHLVGDGLVVPAVSWLERHILYPLATANGG